MDKFEKIRKDFPGLDHQAYLDTATTGLIATNSYIAIRDQIDKRYFTGIQLEEYFDCWKHADQMRKLVAEVINADENEIFFGKDSSEILNVLVANIKFEKGSNVVIPEISFPATRLSWQNREKDGLEVRFVKSLNGCVDINDIFESIDENTVAVSICHVEPSSGFKHNLKKIGDFCSENGTLLVVDSTQSTGAMAIDVKEMKIDFLTTSTYKWLNNVFGIGFGYMSTDLLTKITPRVFGWVGIEDRGKDFNNKKLTMNKGAQKFETGGLNWSGLWGLEKSIDNYLKLGKNDVEEHILKLVEYLYKKVENNVDVTISKTFLNENRSGIVYLKISDSMNIKVDSLKEKGVRVNVASKNKLRVAIHYYNNENDVDQLLNVLINKK